MVTAKINFLLDYRFEMAQAEAVMLLMKCGKIIIIILTFLHMQFIFKVFCLILCQIMVNFISNVIISFSMAETCAT